MKVIGSPTLTVLHVVTIDISGSACVIVIWEITDGTGSFLCTVQTEET